MLKLKEIRLSLKMTQKEVAEKLNIQRTTYNRWETGCNEPSLEDIKNLTRIFNVSYNEIFGANEEKIEDIKLLQEIKQLDEHQKKAISKLIKTIIQ